MTAGTPPMWAVAGQHLLDLTDEEIAALAPGGPEAQTAALPHLSELETGHQTVAIETARRSLLVRGLVAPDDSPEDADTLLVDGLIDDVLQVRVGAVHVVTAQRASAHGTDYLYVYSIEDGDGPLRVAEYVSSGGVHRFTRLDGDAGGVVAEYLAPELTAGTGADGRDAAAGPPAAVRARVTGAALAAGDLPPGLAEHLDRISYRSEFFVLDDTAADSAQPVLHGVLSGAGTVVTSDVVHGTDESVDFTTRTPAEYHAWVDGALRG